MSKPIAIVEHHQQLMFLKRKLHAIAEGVTKKNNELKRQAEANNAVAEREVHIVWSELADFLQEQKLLPPSYVFEKNLRFGGPDDGVVMLLDREELKHGPKCECIKCLVKGLLTGVD